MSRYDTNGSWDYTTFQTIDHIDNRILPRGFILGQLPDQWATYHFCTHKIDNCATISPIITVFTHSRQQKIRKHCAVTDYNSAFELDYLCVDAPDGKITADRLMRTAGV